MRRLLAWLLLSLTMLLAAIPAMAQMRHVTSTRGDRVMISKITPRVDAELPVPQEFAYTLELTADLKSTEKGTVEVRFLRGRPGFGPSSAVAPPIQRPLTRGTTVRVELRSNPVKLADRKLEGENVWVMAILKDASGREVANCISQNRVRGSLKLRPNPAEATSDRIEVLACIPEKNSMVPPGTTTQFVIRFHYSVKSAREAYVNAEFGEIADLKGGTCWYASFIVLPKGTGIAELRVQRYFPNFLEGRSFGIALPLRLSPLGASSSMEEIKPFTFGRAQ